LWVFLFVDHSLFLQSYHSTPSPFCLFRSVSKLVCWGKPVAYQKWNDHPIPNFIRKCQRPPPSK
jgi:hypothetical protein